MKNIIKNLPEYNLEEMDIEKIQHELNVIHLKYIISSFSFSETSTGAVAYNYIQKLLDADKIQKRNMQLENEFKMLGMENCYLRDEITNLKKILNSIDKTKIDLTSVQISDTSIQNSKRGWFFN